MRIDRYIILGGGVASGYAAQEMAKNELAPGELGIISSDDTLPYNRPPLSKAYLAGKKNRQDILINSPEFYEQHGIDVVLNTVVGRVDLDENRLFTSSGDEIQSCTGSEADCAGWRRVYRHGSQRGAGRSGDSSRRYKQRQF